MKPKPRVPIWRWAVWWFVLALALVVFYVLLTPVWIGLRAAAWLAEFRARRRNGADNDGAMADDPKVKALRSAPLFDELSDRELVELARAGDELDVPAGKVLAAEGAPASEFFVVIEGQATVSQGGQEIGLLGPGDFFGEIALVEETPRTATVTAATPLRFFVLTRQRFHGVVERYAEVGTKVRDAVERREAADRGEVTPDSAA